MECLHHVEKDDFPLNSIKNVIGDRKIFVVFSTFGEREADLIYDKITLITGELSDIVDRVFLSHRRADAAKPEITEDRARSAWPRTEVFICNDYQVSDMGSEKGKGSDMRRVLHYINTRFKGGKSDNDIVIVFLDADVVPEHFGSHFVTALAGAILSGYDFAKAGFWREMGRVKKYVAQPLFSSIGHERLTGLTEFSYPLSGEVAGTLAFFNSVHFWQIYGVETGINIDACMDEYKVADVNLGLYDHEHHGDVGIQKMSFGIIRTYLKQLMDYGIIELKDGAVLSDVFRANYIDEKGERQHMEFDLTEKKYLPLKEIL